MVLVITSNPEHFGKECSAKWIAVDTKGSAPPNFEIAEVKITIPTAEEMKSAAVNSKVGVSDLEYKARFTLTSPTNGWPAGQYKADLYIEETLFFTVEFNIAPPLQRTRSKLLF